MKVRVVVALASTGLLAVVVSLTSGAGPIDQCGVPGWDFDCDGAAEGAGNDNCTLIPNPGQRDDDEDGYGNVCDEDVNQDCVVGGPDLAVIFSRFGISNPTWGGNAVEAAFDVNEDGAVGGPDLAQTFARFGSLPGPTSVPCADCTALPATGVCPSAPFP